MSSSIFSDDGDSVVFFLDNGGTVRVTKQGNHLRMTSHPGMLGLVPGGGVNAISVVLLAASSSEAQQLGLKEATEI